MKLLLTIPKKNIEGQVTCRAQTHTICRSLQNSVFDAKFKREASHCWRSKWTPRKIVTNEGLKIKRQLAYTCVYY